MFSLYFFFQKPLMSVKVAGARLSRRHLPTFRLVEAPSYPFKIFNVVFLSRVRGRPIGLILFTFASKACLESLC